MFKNVLVGVDGRPAAATRSRLPRTLIDPDGKLTLDHVHSGEMPRSHQLAAFVRAARNRARGRGCPGRAAQRPRAGPGPGLHEQAEELHADLLVVGSCRHGALGRAMLGDDTRAALNGAPCAVAVASRATPSGRGRGSHQFADVGVAYNGSPESKGALALAQELAAASGATVHASGSRLDPALAYTGIMPPAIGESIEEMLQEAKAACRHCQASRVARCMGSPARSSPRSATGVDILVVGSRGYGPVKRLVLGSTSAYLERHCALLATRLLRSSSSGSRAQRAGIGL